MAKFIQEGRSIDYRPQSAVSAGAVVKIADNFFGAALRGIEAGKLGALRIEGVIEGPKGSDSIDFGTLVYWDGSKFTTTAASGGYIGRAIADRGSTLWVLLNASNLGALTVPTPQTAPTPTATEVAVTGTYADDDDAIAAAINANRADLAAVVAALKTAGLFT
ncbi:MAG: DUF2190 family protein [Lentisphaeria bacterium]|jgi:predicted RecA/RadA family phage recombinase